MTAFLVLTFAIAYPLVSVPILAAHGFIPGGSVSARLHISPDELAGLLLTLGALLPAALFVTWAADGREGVRRLLARMTRWRIGVGWWFVIVGGLPALTVGIALALGDSPRRVDVRELFWDQVVALLLNFALVNLWEEAAWAGFLQTRLERRYNLLVAALIVAVPFGLAHLPLALFDDFTAGSLAVSLLAYLTLGVLFRPMIAVMLRGTRDSVLAVALLHSVFNRTNNENGIAAAVVQGQARQVAMLIAVVVLTGAAALLLRHRLGRERRRELDALPAVATGPLATADRPVRSPSA